MNEINPIPEMVTPAEIAYQLGISEQFARKLMRTGKINGRQIGKQWLTTAEAVSEYQSNLKSSLVLDRARLSSKHSGLRALSFFSGAMGLDLGLERAGIEVQLACEIDKHCRNTIVRNRSYVGLVGDIWKYSATDFLNYAGFVFGEEVDLMVGGPPCQSFSTAGARRGFEDIRGNALLRYVDLILQIRPKYAVIENVRGLLSAPLKHTPHSLRPKGWIPSPDELPGGALNFILGQLRQAGYGVSFNLYNAANFGVPQSRERVILICSRDGEILPHLTPTHSKSGEYGLPKWVTVREAFEGLDEHQSHAEFPEERLRFYRMLKPGQYWKNLPVSLHREALGASLDAGGGKTGFYRRLDWDKPSCTLVTSPCMPATDICHPELDRPISIQEYMRIQQFPDNWIVSGTLMDQYRQIGNAVPVGLGTAVGQTILDHIKGVSRPKFKEFQFSRYKNTDQDSWEKSLQGAQNDMQSALF